MTLRSLAVTKRLLTTAQKVSCLFVRLLNSLSKKDKLKGTRTMNQTLKEGNTYLGDDNKKK